RQVLDFRRRRAAQQSLIRRLFPPADHNEPVESDPEHIARAAISGPHPDPCSMALAQCYLRLVNLPSYPLDRLSRYEAALWRQAGQTIFALHALHRRRPWERASRSSASREEEWQADMEEDN